MDNLPRDIKDVECVARAISSKPKYHVDRDGRLTYKAFQPPKGKSTISVIRTTLGDQFCKRKAKEILGDQYLGLAVLRVGDVRRAGLTVVDTREENYVGHADIDLGIRQPTEDDPLAMELRVKMRSLCEKLLKMCSFRPDPNSEDETWTGPELCPQQKFAD